MPHARQRHAFAQLKKKLGFFRVVSLQGPRQSGKSFLARNLLPALLRSYRYETFDERSHRQTAEENPDSFLARFDGVKLLALDEAQKVPDIFDAVKLKVDLNNRPGQFLLLGSTEFSRETRIRESLTGRLGRVRIYPFNLAETLSLPMRKSKDLLLLNPAPRAKRRDTLRFMDGGGFPGIFSVREKNTREALLEDWMSLVLERDILVFSNLKPNPDLAREILQQVAVLPEPNLASISKVVAAPVRIVKRHLLMLEQLFVITPVRSSRLGSGKTMYYLCDPSLAAHLGASTGRRLQTWLWLEQNSQREYRGMSRSGLSYYRSARGGIIDFVVETAQKKTAALKVISREGFDLRDLEILNAFAKKARANGLHVEGLAVLAPVSKQDKIGRIGIYPWEALV